MIVYKNKRIITAFITNLVFLFPISLLASEADSCNYPLTSVAAELDNDIVFLPSQENSQKQFMALESNLSPTTPEFKDGRIGMTVHFNAQETIADLPISFCMDIGSTCELLPVWDSKKQDYTDYIEIEQIVDDGTSNAYIELGILPNLAEKVRPDAATPLEVTIRGSLACSTNLDRLGVELVKVPVVDLSSTEIKGRASSKNTKETKTPTKYGLGVKETFIDKRWGGDKVSVGLKMTGALDLYREKSKKTNYKWENYFNSNVSGKVDVSIFNQRIQFLTASILPKKPLGKEFETSLKMISFGRTWLDKKLTKDKKTAKARAAQAQLKYALSLGYSVVKETSKSSRIMVGPVPVRVKITAKGELGIKGDIITDIGTSKLALGIKKVGPYVKLGGSTSVGVQGLIFGAGVKASLNLVTEQVGVDITTALQSQKIQLSGSFWNNVEGLKGNIQIYTTRKRIGRKTKKRTKTIFSWSNQYKNNSTIASWSNRAVTQAE